MPAVDVNADLAEGETPSPADRLVLDSVTSASLACGFHAGNREVMRATAEAALARGVTIGAHVSFRDREGFGRRRVEVSGAQLVDDIVEQCQVLDDEVHSVGGAVAFIKPHGALYNLMGVDDDMAAAVVEAVSRHTSGVLVAQSGTAIVAPARRAGLRVVPEGFPDRGYLNSGQLAPRDRPGGLIHDTADVARRAVVMAGGDAIRSVDGMLVSVDVETLCIHGDAPTAPATAAAVRAALEAAGFVVRSFVDPSAPRR
jgi:5-oxoprolinase (ATP-hydrolysing) subunit A